MIGFGEIYLKYNHPWPNFRSERSEMARNDWQPQIEIQHFQSFLEMRALEVLSSHRERSKNLRTSWAMYYSAPSIQMFCSTKAVDSLCKTPHASPFVFVMCISRARSSKIRFLQQSTLHISHTMSRRMLHGLCNVAKELTMHSGCR